MAHEIHQYYFEKYLRNEMSIKDKLTFEEKLSVNSQIRSSFEHYKLNRQEYLSDYAVKQQRSASNRKLNSWIYLLISTLGILLSINFYMDNQDLKQQRMTSSGESVPFYKRIPFFFGWRSEHKKSETDTSRLVIPLDSSSAFVDSSQVLPESNNLAFDQDELLCDTNYRIFDKTIFDAQYASLLTGNDSLSNDSVLELMTIGTLTGETGETKSATLQVQFWRSPIDYSGYKFSGKRLIIYGFTPPFKLTLLKINSDIAIRHEEGNLYTLINDNNFHRF